MVTASRQRSKDREWLTSVLLGRDPIEEVYSPGFASRIVALAEAEGVLSLAYKQLSASRPRKSEFIASMAASFQPMAVRATAQAMVRDHECRKVVACLASAGLEALLLKGVALGHWLYEEPSLRYSGDIDLLMESEETVRHALTALSELGFVARVNVVPGDLVGYQLVCRKESAASGQWEIDLHWKLNNTPLFADAMLWRELRNAAVSLPALGAHAMALSRPHAFLHACVHRAMNLQFGDGERLRWLFDLHLMVQQLGHDDWSQVLSLAKSRGMSGACGQGILATKAVFGTVAPTPVVSALEEMAQAEPLKVERMRSWLYTQRATFRSFPDAGTRLRWLRQRLLPSREYLMQTYADEGGSLVTILARRLVAGVRRARGAD